MTDESLFARMGFLPVKEVKMPRRVLVTGGNRGIGYAIVKGLSKDKECTILMGCRNVEDGQKKSEVLGKNVKAVHLDLSSKDFLHSSLQKIDEQFPRIDVLVNNAGIIDRGSFLDSDVEDIERVLGVNFMAPLWLMHHYLPKMKSHDYGRVVNVSSGWGSFHEEMGGPFGYSVSKAALNALTFAASLEMPESVKINALCPGWVRTDMGGEDADRSPEEGAETAIWLCSIDADGPSGKLFRDRKIVSW